MDDGGARRVLLVHPDTALCDAATATLEAARALIGSGRRVTVAVPDLGPLATAARAAGARVIADRPATRPRRLASALPGVRSAAAIIRRERPAAVVVVTVLLPQWMIAARLAGVPVVCATLGSEWAGRPATRLAATSASRVVVPDAAARDAVVASGADTADVTVVRSPVTGPDTVTPPRPDLLDGIRLVCPEPVGTGSGAADALEVLRILLAGGTRARLVLVRDRSEGDDRAVSSVHALAERLDLGASVDVIDPPANRWSVFEDADIALVPRGRPNPFSSAVTDAVAAARPVVHSLRSGLDGVEGIASAIAVPASGPEALADAVRRISVNWSAFRRTASAVAPIVVDGQDPAVFGRAILAAIGLTTGDGSDLSESVA